MLIPRKPVDDRIYSTIFVLITLSCGYWMSSPFSIAADSSSKMDWTRALKEAPAKDSSDHASGFLAQALSPSRTFEEALRQFEISSGVANGYFAWIPSDTSIDEAKIFHEISMYWKLFQIASAIKAESTTVSTPILNPDHDHRDFGYNFNVATYFHRQCLSEVKKRYEANDFNRPRVLDVGAGFGTMTWKLILAGGHTVAVEPLAPTMEALKQYLREHRSTFLRTGEKLADVSLASSKPILSQIPGSSADDASPELFYAKRFPNHFEVIWLGNIFHFMNPIQTQTLTKLLFEISQPGGKVFALMDSVIEGNDFVDCKNGEVTQTAIAEKAKNNPFPGYLAVNIEQQNSAKGARHCSDVIPLSIEDDSAIGTTYAGSYAAIPDEKRLRKGDAKFGSACLRGPKKLAYHRVLHLFEADTLQRIFEEVGFEVEDVYYINPDDQIVRFASIEEMKAYPRKDLKLAIRARKP